MSLRFLTCASISLKHSHRSAWRDHHRKVQTFPLSVLDLSINLLKGCTSISSNRSSSQSRNIFLLQFLTCPSICLKDSHLFAATVHYGKVEIFSPSVLDLSLNVLEGRRSIMSNRSSLQSRNNFSLGYLSVHQFP